MGTVELNLELTEEQEAIQSQTRKFAREVLRPASLELDKIHDPGEMIRAERFWSTLRKGYELGYHSVFIPDTWGGMGLDPLALHIVLEEMAWGSVDFAVGIGVACFPAFFASMVPNDRLIEEIIEPFCRCQDASIIGCWGITEPDHGSDTLSVGTEVFTHPGITGQVRARRDRDEWVVSGQKSSWVSNGTIATHCLAYLNIDPSMGLAGGGICVVPLDLPGVRKGPPLDKLGQRALNQGEIFFDDVRVPADYMLVDQDSYAGMLDLTLATANAAMGAMFTGVGRAAFEMALEYARERTQGGKILFEHQLIKHKLFDMFIQVEAARALSRAALVYNLNNSPPETHYSIASKVFSTRAAYAVADQAVQILGGMGLSREHPVEKIFRDARAGLVEDGANDSLMITGAHCL
jgi:alkylation response protein AidB-like acyl-CoA dehydrogenase